MASSDFCPLPALCSGERRESGPDIDVRVLLLEVCEGVEEHVFRLPLLPREDEGLVRGVYRGAVELFELIQCYCCHNNPLLLKKNGQLSISNIVIN